MDSARASLWWWVEDTRPQDCSRVECENADIDGLGSAAYSPPRLQSKSSGFR
jgi:hypothetical protein